MTIFLMDMISLEPVIDFIMVIALVLFKSPLDWIKDGTCNSNIGG